MRIVKKILILTILLAGTSVTTFATSYRLDFSGNTDNGTYSGSALLDFSVPDSDLDSSRGLYDGIVTQLSLVVDGVSFASSGSIVNFAAVNNGTSLGDYFGFGVEVADANGDRDLFAIQFHNANGTALGSDALPTSLVLTNFDPFDLANTNSTGVLLPLFAANGIDEFFALSSAQLYAVPLPAGFLLMLSAVATLLGFRSKQT